MSLFHHTVSDAQQAANQQNALASTGARTERGIQFASINGAKHWGCAEAYRRFMPALDEDPKEFEELRQRLHRSLQPRDDFEALLVDDMAEIRWRLRRMIRGEAAVQAKERRQFKARQDQRDAAQEGGGALLFSEPQVAAKLGYVGLHDSPAKFHRIIDFLQTLAALVRYDGFVPENIILLKTVYGPLPSAKGEDLIADYRDASENPAAEPEREAERRENFAVKLETEIAWFETRAELDRQARAEVAPALPDAELLNTRLDPQKVMYYQEGLQRRLERKWKLLMKYRKVAQIEGVREAPTIQVEAAPGEDLAPAPAPGSTEQKIKIANSKPLSC